jgi:membrane-associated phospholipid phosphatase
VLLGGAALSLLVFLWIAGLAAQQHSFGVDGSARGVVSLVHDRRLDAPMQMLSILGEGSGLIPLIALASLFLCRWERRRWALALPVVMAGSGALQLVAKWAVNRPRPNHAPWGFPSGHALTLVVFFGLVAYLLCTSQMGRSWRALGGAFSALAVLAVGFSRLYLDVHWLSDVVAGFMLGLAYLLLTIWSVECLRYRRLRRAAVPFISAVIPPPARAVDSLETSQTATSA